MNFIPRQGEQQEIFFCSRSIISIQLVLKAKLTATAGKNVWKVPSILQSEVEGKMERMYLIANHFSFHFSKKWLAIKHIFSTFLSTCVSTFVDEHSN